MNTQFRDANSVSYETFPFPDMRLADLYLFYAEALNESKAAPDAEVYKYIELVRERAGLEGVFESWQQYSNEPSKPMTKNGMSQIIKQERKIKLACEGPNYWNINR